MLGLPKTTELSRQLPKKIIYEKFNMKTVEKDNFDEIIKKITIVNEVTSNNTTIAGGKDVTGFYVLHLCLKRKEYDEKIIQRLSNLINQKILFILDFENEARLAVNHTKLLQNDWHPVDNIILELRGLNFDSVWKEVIIQVGSIVLKDTNSLEDQIRLDERRVILQKKLLVIEKKARSEKQPKRKFELFQEIKKIKKELEEY